MQNWNKDHKGQAILLAVGFMIFADKCPNLQCLSAYLAQCLNYVNFLLIVNGFEQGEGHGTWQGFFLGTVKVR